MHISRNSLFRNFDDFLRELGLSSAASSGKKVTTTEELQRALIVAGDEIRKRDEEICRLSSYPIPISIATAISVKTSEKDNKVFAVLIHEGKLIEISVPSDKQIMAGDTVRFSSKTLQIVGVDKSYYSGTFAVIRNILDENKSEVDYCGTVKVVSNGRYKDRLETGDRVVLDGSASIILDNRGKTDERYKFTQKTNVSWEDIGGQKRAKTALIEAIEMPFTHKEIYSFYKKDKRPTRGILLYGPPGCGKTLLGKAAATAMAKIHNSGGVPTGFIYIKGPEILDRYVGAAEATIKQLFQMARSHKEKEGYPAILFVDEADAILYKRGTGRSSDVERTIVPMFLAEMDGLLETGAIVLLATNRPDILDNAITRPGRIDSSIEVERPDRETALLIFKDYFKNVPLFDFSIDEAAELATDELFSEKRVLYEITLGGSRKGEFMKFTLKNLASGAMIAGIVDKAASEAMHHDIAQNTMQGITKGDIITAVSLILKNNIGLNHVDELEDFTHDFMKDIENVKKLRQTMV